MTIDSLIPSCVAYDPYQIKGLSDVAYILKHEIDMYEEGQDGALDYNEIVIVRKSLSKVYSRMAKAQEPCPHCQGGKIFKDSAEPDCVGDSSAG